jgi:hypothetical protein
MKKQERKTEKGFVTFASSRSLLGRGDLRAMLSYQSYTLIGASACLSYNLGFLSFLWWEKEGWRGLGIIKTIAKGVMVEGAGHY